MILNIKNSFNSFRTKYCTILPLVFCLAGHLIWQVVGLRPEDGANALARFRANHAAGALMALAAYVVGNAGIGAG